ncbi:MAG: hypothetical protein AAB573_05075 [Patescibacteria group bacterium]
MTDETKKYTPAEIDAIRRRKTGGERYKEIVATLELPYQEMVSKFSGCERVRPRDMVEENRNRFMQELAMLKRGAEMRDIAFSQNRPASSIHADFDSRGITSKIRQVIVTKGKRRKWLTERAKRASANRRFDSE